MNNPTSASAKSTGHFQLPAWIDRPVAVIAALPFIWTMWQSLQQDPIPVESFLLCANLGLMALTMVTRRAPTRVTTNPWFWLLALVATYWPYLTEDIYTSLVANYWPSLPPYLYELGAPLVSHFWSESVSILGFLICIWARVCLGRNIGFVPAERKIVTTGVYGWVRHPVYTGLFLVIIGNLLVYFSWNNFVLTAIWMGLWIIKTFVEENFLRKNPAYAEYMTKVRWRWVPYLA